MYCVPPGPHREWEMTRSFLRCQGVKPAKSEWSAVVRFGAQVGPHVRSEKCHMQTSRPAANFPVLFNHLVCTSQQRSWNIDAQDLRSLEVDEQFKLGRLLDRQVGWLATFEDFVHVGAAQPEGVGDVRSIGHQPAQLHKLLAHGDKGQPEFCGEVDNPFSLSEKHWTGKYYKRISSLIRNRGERLIQFVRPPHSNQSKLQAQGLRCPFCLTHHVVHRARAISAGMPEGGDSKKRGKRFLEQSQTLRD